MGTITAEVVETGDKRDERGRKISTRERRAELVHAYQESGLTMAEFARREGLRYSTFAGWVEKNERMKGKPEEPVRFAQVQLPAAVAGLAAGLEVRLSDGTVVRGNQASEVAALVRALRA